MTPRFEIRLRLNIRSGICFVLYGASFRTQYWRQGHPRRPQKGMCKLLDFGDFWLKINGPGHLQAEVGPGQTFLYMQTLE